MLEIITNVKVVFTHWDSSNPKLINNAQVFTRINIEPNPLLSSSHNMNFLKGHQLPLRVSRVLGQVGRGGEEHDGPPDMRTNIVGPLEALATLATSSCCNPGKRRLTRSLASLSIDWSNPMTRTVASEWRAAISASPKFLLVVQATPEQPG
nr:hypothetical protein Iba_chr06bCG11200 [Ipomoea batatas]